MEKRLKYKKYCFVPYNLSDKQKMIQAGHASEEYDWKYHNEEDYKSFFTYDKTWIVLNGGTSNDGHLGNPLGTMNEIYREIKNNGIHHSVFYEPDINSALTAICFLADERVWDYETYPDFIENEIIYISPEGTPYDVQYRKYEDWEKSIGGKKNAFIRNLIKNKKLA